jgi:hypothetical protein
MGRAGGAVVTVSFFAWRRSSGLALTCSLHALLTLALQAPPASTALASQLRACDPRRPRSWDDDWGDDTSADAVARRQAALGGSKPVRSAPAPPSP